MVFACGGDDATTGTEVLPSQDAAIADGAPDATTSVDGSASDAATVPDGNSALDAGAVTDGGTCTASDLDMTAAALTVAVGAGNVSLASPAPASGFYNVTSIKKPDAAALGTNYRGLLAFTATSIFLTEQWDNGPVVKRKASYVVTNGAFVITPLCGEFPGSHTWKFYYDGAPDAGGDGKKRVRVILPGLSSDKGYELNLTKTI
jgi:hypothetical protein